MNMDSIELFAGAGGLGLGTSLAGFVPRVIVEFNRDCRKTLARNKALGKSVAEHWPNEIGLDVRDQNYDRFADRIDLVSGGPPCQPFSMGGRHAAQADARDMFPEAVRAVRETRPKVFLFENVKGLTRESFAGYFEYVRLQLAHPSIVGHPGEDWGDHLRRLQRHHTSCSDGSADYRVVTQVLNAADFGVPQQRHRVFFVGIRADLGIEYTFPVPTHSRAALLRSILSEEYMERHSLKLGDLSLQQRELAWLENARSKGIKGRDIEDNFLPWRTTRDAIQDLPVPQIDNSSFQGHIRKDGAKAYKGHTGSHLDFPAKALKAGVHGVPGGENMLRRADGSVRYFTARESARLQTFPDDYEITGSWSEAMRQLGNAVPVELACVVAKKLREALDLDGSNRTRRCT